MESQLSMELEHTDQAAASFNTNGFHCTTLDPDISLYSDVSEDISQSSSNSLSLEGSYPRSITSDFHTQVSLIASQDTSQFSLNSTCSTTSTKKRRFVGIQSLSSTQKKCCICFGQGRCRIPKPALSQVCMEKSILIPHENRVCAGHLFGVHN